MIDIDCSPSKRRKMSDPNDDPGTQPTVPELRVLTTRSGYVVSYDELCRVIMQALHDLSLDRTRQTMEKESHLSLMGQTTILLSAIIDSGNWDHLLSDVLSSLSWPTSDNLEKAKNAVYCLQALELCIDGDSEKVLSCIRRSPESLHGPLSSLLMFTKQSEIRDRFVKLFGEEFSSRVSLKSYIQSLSNAKDCLDDHRLLSILDSAYSNVDAAETLLQNPFLSERRDRDESDDSAEDARGIVTPGRRTVSFTELVRLIYFGLLGFGYSLSAKTLLDESGVQFDYEMGGDLQHDVLAGRWDAVHSAFNRQHWQNLEALSKAKQAVLRQHFLELCESGCFNQAIELLRCDDAKALTALSRFIMFTDPDKLREAAHFDGAKGNSRLKLWENLQTLLQREHGSYPVQIIDLLDAAIDFDVKHCNFHNRQKTSLHPLLRHHTCTDDDFPNSCIQTLYGHTDEIWFIAFSEDGSRLASASKDATVRIWEMRHDPDSQWYQLHALHINAKHVSYLCWSSDGCYLVTCASKKRVFVWDVNTGFKLSTLRGHKEQVLACAWINCLPPKIATGSVDHQIIIWSLNGERLYNWRTPNAIHNLCVSKDQKCLFAHSSEFTVRAYDLDRMELVSEFHEESQKLTSFSISNVEPYLLVSVSGPSSIHMWNVCDLKSPSIAMKFFGAVQDKFIVRCGFGGVDDHFVISGSEDCNVIIWNRHTGEQLCSLSGHQGSVNSVSWNPTNPLLFASASDDHTIRIWAAKNLTRQ